MRDKILVIDDEPNLRKVLEVMLTRAGYEIFCFESFEAAKVTLNTENLDLVLSDLQMPVESGMDVLAYCKHYSPDLPVVLITAFGTVERAVSALKAGAFDFILKPFEQDELFRVIEKAIQSRRQRRREPALEMISAVGVGPVPIPLFGSNPQTLALKQQVDLLSKTGSPLLMYGEVGTGKRSIAYEIHRRSDHARGPFIQLNVDAVPPVFQLTELFGVEKGANPVALFSKPGSLELAQSGTVLIEEVNAFSVDAQNALFLALENDYFSRVGGLKKFPLNFRLIATASKDLSEMVKQGSFHVELFYKLSVGEIILKPLRERRDDIESHFIPYFLERACRKRGIPQIACSSQAKTWLIDQIWPGNLGELERKIAQAVNLAVSDTLELSDLRI